MTPESPLPYRLRSEIEWTSIGGRRREWWVAIDPLRSQFFRCGDEERRLLQSLDGRRSILDLKRLCDQNGSSQHVSTDSIQKIVQSAIQKQLLAQCSSDVVDSRHGNHAKYSTNVLHNVLISKLAGCLKSIQRWPFTLVQGRLRLGKAEWLSNALAIRTDWLFSFTAVRLWIIFVSMSALLVLTKLLSQNRFTWPSVAAIESNAASYLLILLSTRILHELGHAIVCTRMRARCREFGIFFMLGIACPYVNVTDSWRLKDYRKRMAVAAAGVYVEWIIAAVAGLIWYVCQPGWLPALAWQIMAVCSLTTLLINANPLLRYDGYFLLSDLLDVTNLREDAERRLKILARAWCFSDRSIACERWPSFRDSAFVAYACASWLYRGILIVFLVWTVHAIATRWNLPVLGWAFAALSIVSFLFIPLGQTMFQTWSAARHTPQGPYRVAAIWLGIATVIASLICVPLPHRIACHGSIQPEKRTVVYTEVAGRIPLDRESSASLVALENPWLTDQARLAEQRQRQLECRVASLRQAAYQQPTAIDQLPAMMTLVAIAEKQSIRVSKELNSLVVSKPLQGTWVACELPPLESLDGNAAGLQGHTIESIQSRGRWLPAGTPIGYVAPSDRVCVATTIPVAQLSCVQLGMPARVRFDQLPNRVYSARVAEISDMTAVGRNVASSRTASDSTSNGNASESDSYVSISLTIEGVSQRELAMSGTAEAVIWSTPRSLYYHAKNFLGATFGPSEQQTISR